MEPTALSKLQLPKSPQSYRPTSEGAEKVLTLRLPANSGYPAERYPELTPEEEQAALSAGAAHLLIEAQKAKYHLINRQQHEEKMRQLAYVPSTPEELLQEVMRRGQQEEQKRGWRLPFALDQYNESIYRLLSMYFTGDAAFETEGPGLIGMEPGSLSLRKGLLLAGGVGVGKTVMMQLFARNPYQPYVVVNCLNLEADYDRVGAEVFDTYGLAMPINGPTQFYGHRVFGVCFDDYGAEQEGKHYGKVVDIMEKILQLRYASCIGPMTHLTTNASLESLQETIKPRVLDRMIEMFNLIEFDKKAPSRRI